MGGKYFTIGTIIATLVLLILIYYASLQKSNSVIDKFTKKIEIIPFFFICIGIYLTYEIFKINLENINREATFKIIDRGWLGVNKAILENYDKCPAFCDSLYFPWQRDKLGVKSQSNNKNDWYAVNYISNMIFQGWEDFLTSATADETGYEVWIANFLQWTSSPMLKSAWAVLSPNYANTTIIFGDLLFNFAQKFKPVNERDLLEMSIKISKEEDFLNIIKKRHT